MYALTYLSNDSTLKKSRFFKISSGGLRRHSYFSLGFPPGTAPFRGRDKAGIILRGIRRQSRAATHQNDKRCNSSRCHQSRQKRKCCSNSNEGSGATTKPPKEAFIEIHLILKLRFHFCTYIFDCPFQKFVFLVDQFA